MLLALAGLIALAYLPGALLYRLPIADRPRRAALPADERAFWAVILSCTITTLAALALAAAGAYTFQRLLAADIALAAVLLVTVRGRLGYGSTAAPLSWTLLLPAALAAVGLYLFFPPSEYIMGGKDPGTYINEGIRIGQQGSLTIHDATLAAVPEEFRGMFLAGDPAEIDEGLHQGVRFMGFFVTNRSRGDVMGQFPHGFPIWIAVGYGLDGLTGARRAVGAWALLGLLAVYFAGARLAGRAPAFIGTLLLAINVAVVWYARYPNSELMQQALLFAALLALARAYRDDDRFFAPVAAVLLGSLMFVRLDSLVILAAVGAALLLVVADGKRLGLAFLAPLAALLAAAAAYFAGPLRAYLAIPMLQVGGARGLSTALVSMVGAGLIVGHVRRRWPALIVSVQRWAPRILVMGVVAAAAYAYASPRTGRPTCGARCLCAPGVRVVRRTGRTGRGDRRIRGDRVDPVLERPRVPHDRSPGVGVLLLQDPHRTGELLAGSAVPGCHPAVCLPDDGGGRVRRVPAPARTVPVAGSAAREDARRAALPRASRIAVLAFVGWTFVAATRPILNHVEYAGLIPALERLAGAVRSTGPRADRTQVLVGHARAGHAPRLHLREERAACFRRRRPGRAEVGQFLAWATRSYDRVFLIAEGGLDLASPSVGITPIRNERFSIPEYESARNAYPREVRQKKFNLNIFQLQVVDQAAAVVDLDIGGFDDPWVLRMFARQEQDGVTYRWVRDRSFVTLIGVPASAARDRDPGRGRRPARGGRPCRRRGVPERSRGREVHGPRRVFRVPAGRAARRRRRRGGQGHR